jgi:hypothetical protein
MIPAMMSLILISVLLLLGSAVIAVGVIEQKADERKRRLLRQKTAQMADATLNLGRSIRSYRLTNDDCR